MHSLYTNEVTDFFKPVALSLASIHQLLQTTEIMCLLNCARVKDHLHDSQNWPRYPFDRSNFVRLFSTLRILSFHCKWMEIRGRVVLKRCVKWLVVTLARLRDLQSRQRWSEGAFSIIYVEISGHELRTVWRRSKLKNKIWHSGHNKHIALLKRTQKKLK